MSTLPPILHQGRSLALRRTAPQDAPLLFQQMYQNPEFMRLFRLNDAVNTEAQLAERLAQRLQSDPAKSGYLELLLLHQRHGAIGLVALADYAPLYRRAEFLIGLFSPAYRHRSYGLEGGLLVGDLVFNQYNLHRLYAYTYEYNHYAQKSLKAGGFLLEGMLHDHVFDSMSQRFVDLHVYGMTAPHFRQNARLAVLAKRLIGRDVTQPPTPTPLSSPVAASSPSFVRSGSLRLKGNW